MLAHFRLVAKQVGILVATEVHHDLLEHDAWVLGMYGQRVLFTSANGQRDLVFYHATGNGGIELAVHIRLAIYQVLVEVHRSGLTAIQRDGIFVSAAIGEVEC